MDLKQRMRKSCRPVRSRFSPAGRGREEKPARPAAIPPLEHL